MGKAEKRKEICDVAAKLFVERGFEKTTTRDIASAAGVNTSAIYYYFEDKESILYELLIDIMNNSLRQMRDIEKRDMSLQEKINAVIKLHTHVYGIDPNTMELIVYKVKTYTSAPRRVPLPSLGWSSGRTAGMIRKGK